MPMRRHGWILLGLGLVLGATLTLLIARHANPLQAQERTTVALTPQERTTLASFESALTRIAETVQPTVVHIRVVKQLGRSSDGEIEDPFGFFERFRERLPESQRIIIPPPRIEGEGSGVIIRSDGYIVTNDHVVSNAKEVEVTFHDGTKAKGEVIRAPSVDIALVKVDRKNLPAAVLGDSSTVKPGQLVFAIGSPFGLENTFTMGIVSAVGRREQITGSDRVRFYPDLIQTDAAINQGNSGGPLVNSRGEVIGINTAIVSGFAGGNVGIGFAIPINRVKAVVKRLLEEGAYKRGYLGVGLRNLTPELREELKVQNGVLVEAVEAGTPADRAGIQPGDVIVEFDGKPVENEVALRDAIAEKGPNARVSIKVVRDGRTLTLNATLGTHPEDAETETPKTAQKPQQDALQKLGLRVSEIPAELRERVGTEGVYVESVASDSPASEVLQRGDVILSVNRTPVRTPEELERALSRIPSGQMARLAVKRVVEGRVFHQLVMFRMP